MCLYITHNQVFAINELQKQKVFQLHFLLIPLSCIRRSWYTPILINPSVNIACGMACVSLQVCNCSLKNIFMLQVCDQVTMYWALNGSKTQMTYTLHCTRDSSYCCSHSTFYVDMVLIARKHKRSEHGVSRLVDLCFLLTLWGQLHLLCYRPDLLHAHFTL